MSQIKICTFNTEWMYSIFGAEWTNWQPPTIPATFPGAKRGDIELEPIADVHLLCRRLAGVIKGSKAQIIGIQEGPPRKDQMEAFVSQFLNNDYVVYTSNSTTQTIHALVHKSVTHLITPWEFNILDWPKPWQDVPYYPWGKIDVASRKKHDLFRHPLTLKLTTAANKQLFLMILHTKSKFSKLKTAEDWIERKPEAILDALDVRAKISAELYRIRTLLDSELLGALKPKSIVIMGDLNDGPFAELIESEFLIRNIIDELSGTLLNPDAYFHHAMQPDVLRNAKTVRFPDPVQNGAIVEELLDHVLLSPGIWQRTGDFRLKAGSCKVETELYKKFDDTTDINTGRDQRPSDHKPVTFVLTY